MNTAHFHHAYNIMWNKEKEQNSPHCFLQNTFFSIQISSLERSKN